MGSNFPSLPVKRTVAYTAPVTGMGDSYIGLANGSSKSKRFKQPPPLIIPPGHVAFRMLCHASRIGGVIGKSGLVIKQLQQSTGAKIRVEEAPKESPDRIVTVIGPPALTSRVLLDQNPSENGVSVIEVEASKAQDALLKVFERILEVAAESEGVGIGAEVGVVSCRLLAEVAQVGSVIGKGGKVVEKIRKESGCKIRVLTDKLPACAGPSDEMIEIEGDVLAIKKALLAVSRCLQDCPPSEKMRMVASRPAEAVIHETLPDLHLDHILQRNSILPILPSNSSIFASGIHSFSTDSDVLSPVDTEVTQQDVVFKILCANDRIGGVIGKGGTIIRALQNESGATVSVGPSVAGCDERLISITASENIESRYSPAQKAVVLVFSRYVDVAIEKGQDMSSNKGASIVARLVVPSNQVGCVLGKGGVIISEIRKVTGTNIRIISSDHVPKCAAESDEIVQISGEFSNVQDALYNVTGRLRDNLFSNVLSNSGARNGAGSYIYPETSPYGRLRDPAPLARTTPVGASHSSFIQHTTQSTDDLGLSHSLDSSSSPGLWASQSLSGISSRTISDAGRGLPPPSHRGGVHLGSGSKTALVTNTTVELIVPEDVISLVYGENGTNLARLRQISGAMVTVHEPDPLTSNRLIVISGTPDETQAAQSLLHAFILTGSS
ncbi:KH domain-containing protein HEN4-like [Cucurbita pepo subsp. pepo]|uniref:KH domain-containing protein HEN4-like n=1 Tax=Cucurbita pepo subsp. pepo TaxID=3664 RepID=UPI000C9D91DE|nr:KH domain-containing protein HEN4-like [Cucurbita pepo subsp. pepo]